MTGQRRSYEVEPGLTVTACGTNPLDDGDRQALAEIARAAVGHFDADRESVPVYVRMVLHNLAAALDGKRRRNPPAGFGMTAVARAAGVRIADLSRAFQESPRLPARAANALAEWAAS